MKILYFDVETTGTDAWKNDIVQLSGLLEVDGEVVEKFNYKCQPFNYDNVSAEALEVTGLTIEEIKKYPEPYAVYEKFVEMLKMHIGRFDKNDKAYLAGYNVNFDVDFLSAFFKKNNDKYFGSWFNWRKLDPLPVIWLLDAQGHIKLDNYKLSTVCAYFGIEIDAHDAMSDILATHKLLKDEILPLINKPKHGQLSLA